MVVKESFGLAGIGLSMGIIGNSFNSQGLREAGSTAVGFIPIAANIGMGSLTINMLKDLKTSRKSL